MLEAVNNPWELLGGGYDKMYEQKNLASHWKQTKRLVSDVLLITGKVTDTPTNPASSSQVVQHCILETLS